MRIVAERVPEQVRARVEDCYHASQRKKLFGRGNATPFLGTTWQRTILFVFLF
jgi:hypothetical protein